ncbi:hypothetical protein, partial [Streptomyces sp. NPDC005009]
MTYDFTRHLREITAWYSNILTSLCSDSPDREAKELILNYHETQDADGGEQHLLATLTILLAMVSTGGHGPTVRRGVAFIVGR